MVAYFFVLLQLRCAVNVKTIDIEVMVCFFSLLVEFVEEMVSLLSHDSRVVCD